MRRFARLVLLSALGLVGCALVGKPNPPARGESGRVAAAAGPASDRLAAKMAPSTAGVGILARDQGGDLFPPTGWVIDSAGAQPANRGASQMVIRTGQVSVEVDSLARAIRLVGELAAASGGYLANTSIQTGENAPRTATLEVKVPADRYQGAIDRLATIGKVVTSTTTAADVGEEYVDVSARMTNARRLEERLVTLLATRTGKLDDVLSVERELARVREEIERYEGRLRYLKTQVAMSTISITVFEPGPLVGDPGQNVILNALEQSWRNFVAVVAGGIAIAGGLVPVAIAVGLVLLVVRRGWRRLRPRAAT